MSKLEDLKSTLASLGAALRSDGIYFRLIMSDDIKDMTDIRERAKARLNWLGKNDKDNGFFHGITIRQELQDQIDYMVRNLKPQLLEVIDGGEPNWQEFGIEVVEDKKQDAYLILLSHCCAGFYVSRRQHTPREDRKKRTTLSDIKHQASMKPVTSASKDQPVTRKRKFTTIRHHVN